MPTCCPTHHHRSRASVQSGVKPRGWGPMGGRHQSHLQTKGRVGAREILGAGRAVGVTGDPGPERETKACITAASAMLQRTGVKDDAREKFICRFNKDMACF